MQRDPRHETERWTSARGEARAALRASWTALAGSDSGTSDPSDQPVTRARAWAVAAVLSTTLAVIASAVSRAMHCGDLSALELAVVAVLAAGAVGSIALARHLRGRLAWVDVVHPLAWLVPWHVQDVSVAAMLACASASPLAIGFSCGWRTTWTWLRETVRDLSLRVDQRTVGLFVLFVLFWLPHLALPTRTPEPNLDSSWAEVKGYELVHGWQCGLDTVFTFGPLGYFHPAPYVPELFWTKVLWWEIAFKIVLTAYLVLAVRRMGGPLEKTVFCLGLLSFFPGQDAFFFMTLTAISLRMLQDPRPSGFGRFVAHACMAILSLVKFTSFVLVAAFVTLIAVHRLITDSRKSALRVLALHGVILLSIWTLIGQSPLNLPRYVLTSFWIAQGYNQAMTWRGPNDEIALAYAIVPLIALVGLLGILQRPRDRAAWVGAAVLCTGAFVALKAGFVRHGGAVTFFGFATVATFLLPALEPRTAWQRVLRGAQSSVRIACALLAAYAFSLPFGGPNAGSRFFFGLWSGELITHADNLVTLPELHARLDNGLHVVQEHSVLPEIKARVGHERIDVFGSMQGMAIMNHLNYAPRPVIQSYSAYTHELAELNERFYTGPRAPRFVMFMYESLEDRLPGSEDNLALHALMREYSPVASEGGFLLFERHPPEARRATERRLVHERTIGLDESIELEPIYAGDEHEHPALPGRRACFLVELDIRLTVWGKLRAALVKGTPPRINGLLSTGEMVSFRGIPAVLSSGVLIHPLLDSQETWVNWYCDQRVQHLSRIQVSTQKKSSRALFDPEIAMRIVRDDSLSPRIEPSVAKRLRYSMFKLNPNYVRSPNKPWRARAENREVLVVGPGSELCFPVPPGRHSIRAKFGILPFGSEQECSDGAAFSVTARDAQGVETPLAHREIEANNDASKWMHNLSVELESAAPAKVLFRIGPRAAGDAKCDWTYWSDVAITEADATAAK